MRRIMQAPVAGGVLTRRDDQNTPEDERLHDQNSRDVGIVGNITNTPILSLFDGKVVTADWYPAGAARGSGYGLTVRIEGRVRLTKEQVRLARAPWPLGPMDPWNPFVEDEPDGELDVRVLYGHHHELWVMQGNYVSLFQPLGGMGNTGKSQGNHSHIKMRLMGVPEPKCFVDPLPLFRYIELQ